MQSLKIPAILTPANPIVNAEFRHQRFVIRRGRVGWIWIILAGVMVAPALLISVGFTIAGLLLPVYPSAREIFTLSAGFMPAWLWLAIMMVAMYPVVTLITFGLSANSVRREKTGNTWDNLRLSRLHPKQIVIGKWWASLRALNGDHGMVTILRFGVSATAFMALSEVQFIPSPFGLPVEWTVLPILLIITLIYSVLDAGLSAALGIAGAMVDIGGPTIPFMLFSVRVGTAFVALLLWIFTLFTMPLGIGHIIIVSCLGFVGYGLVTYLVLRVAQQLVR